MDPVETYERNKLTINILRDEFPDSPRDWDNVGTMICSHRRYMLGDEPFNPGDYEGWQDLEKYLREERKAVIVLPLGLYDHSGITMYVGDTHDRWDGGQVGFIYCTQEDIDKNCESIESAERLLRSEVETYDQYLRGDVYGFTITNPKNGEEIDSCWGLYGVDEAREYANDSADSFQRPRDAAYAETASALHR